MSPARTTVRKTSRQRRSSAACGRCEDRTSHCHALLLAHVDGTFECTEDPTCDHAEERHDAIEVCTDHDPSCRCDV